MNTREVHDVVQRTVLLAAMVGLFVGCGTEQKAPGPVELDEATHEPEEDPAVVSVEVGEDELVFELAGGAEPSFGVGSIVVGTAYGGYLRRIEQLERTGDRLVAQTSQASLEEAVKSGSFEGTLVSAGSPGWLPAAKEGASYLATATDARVDFAGEVIYEGEFQGVPVQIKATRGSISFSPEVTISGNIFLWTVSKLELRARGTLESELELEVTIGGSLQNPKEEREVDLSGPNSVYFTHPFSFPLGPLPVVGTVEFDVFAGFEIDTTAAGTVKFGVTGSSTVEVGARYADGAWTPSIESSQTRSALPLVWTADASARIKGWIRPEVRTVFYGVAGPSLSITPSLEGRFTILPGPPSWSLVAAVAANLGFKLQVFGKTLKQYNKELFGVERILFTDQLPDFCGDLYCGAAEFCDVCSLDCGLCPYCGDDECAPDENAFNCPADCPDLCDDGYCTGNEDAAACPNDCPDDCGDGHCTGAETPLSCLTDCPADCGDGLCSDGESPTSCGADCPAVCPDGACTGAETASSCPGDCPDSCGDWICTGAETYSLCPDDCLGVEVTRDGSGAGTIASDVGGIECGDTCVATFAEGDVVTLTATSGGNSVFDGWSGDCPGTDACVLTIDGSKSVTATFRTPGATLWSETLGKNGVGLGDVNAHDVAVDASGNLYVVGEFSYGTDFGGTTLNPGNTDAFIAKYDPDGVLIWARQFGGSENDVAWSAAVDSGGNVIVAGEFGAGYNFGKKDIWVAKFSAATGALDWSQTYGSSEDDAAYGIAVDSHDRIVVTGRFIYDVSLGGAILPGSAAFVAQYDAAGTHLWSQAFAATGWEVGHDVAVGPADVIAVTGTFSGTMNLGGSDLVSISNTYDVFVAKFTSDGSHRWSQSHGGSSSGDWAEGITIDASGNVVVVGSFEGSANFGGSSLVGAGGTDAYITKYDAAGAHLWSRRIGGVGTDGGESVATDMAGNILVVGQFYGTVDFGALTLEGSGRDAFATKFDSSGANLWAVKFGGFSNDRGEGVAVTPNSQCVIAGSLAELDYLQQEFFFAKLDK